MKSILMSFVIVCFIIITMSNSAFGETQIGYPSLKSYVNDYANVLSSNVKQNLENTLQSLYKTDSTQLVILTVDNMNGEDIKDYSLHVATSNGIGQKGKDNGILITIAKKEKKIRIEVGYGLEGVLTDVICNRIIRNDITPNLKKNLFDVGIVNGVNNIIKVVKGEYTTTSDSSGLKDITFFGWIIIIAIIIVVIAAIIFISCKMGGSNYVFYGGGSSNSSSSSSSSSFGGGGGGFGGGGSDGDW